MPSLRKRVSSYFRQLSFHNEQRRRHNVNENSFITKYLQGHITITEGPPIIYGKNPTDLPTYDLGVYDNGPDTVVGCYSGPNGGLTTVKRREKHLSVLDDDIDYIDTHDEEPDIQSTLPKKSNQISTGQPIDNATMVIKVAGNEYCVINRPKRHSKSHSLGSIKDFNIEIEKTKIDKSFYSNNISETVECKNNYSVLSNNKTYFNVLNKEQGKNNIKDDLKHNILSQKKSEIGSVTSEKGELQQHAEKTNENNYHLSKSKSEGNPFHHQKKGKVIKIERPNIRGGECITNNSRLQNDDDLLLPKEWRRKSEYVYGLSDSLYDKNLVTKNKNGNPIADCFGIIARSDSAILAVADGVNWGEKASIAAKSAVHGSLHYLNKTIFNDTKPFENLTIKTDQSSLSSAILDEKVNLISSTREVFICLLRAFNCAHDLILENKGMLTTLTVAVVLPLKQKSERRIRTPNGEKIETEIQYVCCVCNVGDTLAYIYSRKYGIRELTKGSHDINCNRDMRDALGALGPVDGINPELSNLTLSITTLQKGDIVMVASDGLTDNFDPNVCKFAINIKNDQQAIRTKQRGEQQSRGSLEIKPSVKKPTSKTEPAGQKPPLKPPRKSKTKYVSSRNTSSSNFVPNKSSSSSVKTMAAKDNIGTSLVQHSNQLKIDNSGKNVSREIEVNSNTGSSVNYDVESEYNPLKAAFMSQNSLDETPKCEKINDQQSTVVTNITSSQTPHDTLESSQRQDKSNTSLIGDKKIVEEEKFSKTTSRMETGYKFLRSKTTIDIRSSNTKPIVRNEDGIPYITPNQRYDLQLLLMEDILKNGLTGKDSPCTTAKQLCENLISYTISITSAKRHTLEDQDFYFDDKNGVLSEVSGHEKKIRRKKGLEKVQNLPGKLDHVTVVAYNVGVNFAN